MCNVCPFFFLSRWYDATEQKRKVDAVYYYMRNLMSSNPIASAKENLLTLFDEIRKKVRREIEGGSGVFGELVDGDRVK